MRSLFLKIFLWFWAAMVLVVVVSFVAAGLFRRDLPEAQVRAGLAPGMSLFAEVAVDRYEDGGAGAVRALFRRLGSGAGLGAYVFDADLREVTGAAVPVAVEELARRTLESGELEFESDDDTISSAHPVVGRGGDVYVVAQVRDRGRVGRFGTRPGRAGAGTGAGAAPGARRGWRRDAAGNLAPPAGLPPGPPAPDPVLRWADLIDPRTATARWSAAVLTTILVCFGLARYIASPVRRLRDAASRFAEGDLSARAGSSVTRRGDEIGQLGREFDHMAGRIEKMVTQQRHLLRDISHELRTPLARLSVALGIARRSAEVETAGSLDRIEQETERLNDLIGQTLALARLEGGAEQIERGRVDLRCLVEEVVADAAFEAEAQGRSVTLVGVHGAEPSDRAELSDDDEPSDRAELSDRAEPSDTATIQGAELVLRSAVENVVRNGIRYTAEGTNVSVRFRTRGTVAVVTVRDHGSGVPEEALGELFRPFYRVTDARERRTGGTGLGLAIAQRAVELHGGTIAARNHPDGGLVVEIVLPTG